MRKELRDIKASRDNFNKDFEDMRTDVKTLERYNASLSKESTRLR